MIDGLVLAKGAGQGTPPFWMMAIILIAIIGAALSVSKARRR